MEKDCACYEESNPIGKTDYKPIIYIDLFACGCRIWISIDIASFYEEQCQPSQRAHMAGLPKNGKSGAHCRRMEVLTQFAQQFAKTAVITHRLYDV